MSTTQTGARKLTAKQNITQMIKFTAFSCSAGVIQIVCFTLLTELFHATYWPAYLIALIASVVYNFTLNRRFTFHSSANVPVAMLKVLGYYCVFTPLSTIGGNYLTDVRLWNSYVVLAFFMVLNFITEFLFCRFVVFNQKENAR